MEILALWGKVVLAGIYPNYLPLQLTWLQKRTITQRKTSRKLRDGMKIFDTLRNKAIFQNMICFFGSTELEIGLQIPI